MKNFKYFVITLIVYGAIFLIGFFLVKFTNIESWGDNLSLGQLLVELSLIPLAIYGFVVTVNEIKKSQEKAILDIGWLQDNELDKAIERNRSKSIIFKSNAIILRNTGTTPAIHYQVSIDIPKECGRAQMTMDHWRYQSRKNHRFIFGSTQEYVSFPESDIDLGKITFRDAEKLPSYLLINYRIYVDKGKYVEGQVSLTLKEKETP